MKSRITYIVLSLIFLLIHFNSFGQKQKPKNDSWYDDKPFHFGFSLGVNTMDFNITPLPNLMNPIPSIHSFTAFLNPEVIKLMPGFNIQIVTNLRVAKYLDIRFLPGISFGQRTVRYYYEKQDANNVCVYKKINVYGVPQKLNPASLEFPILLKFKGDRLNNVRPYVIGGLNLRDDLNSKKNFDGTPPYIRLKKLVPYYELGAGLDFYLKYFKLSVEMKMANGIGDVLDRKYDPANPYYDKSHPEYYTAIDKMKSQIWILAFHFE